MHRREANLKSDLWSYGITILETYSEDSAWGSQDYNGLVSMINRVTPDVSKVPEFLKNSLRQCFSSEESTRPSMEEILNLFND